MRLVLFEGPGAGRGVRPGVLTEAGVVERQQVDQRLHADMVSTLDGGGQEDTGRGRHAQRRGLMLCQVIAVQASLVGVFQRRRG